MKILMFGRGVIATVNGWALERAGHDVEFYVRPGRAAQYGDTIDLDLLDTRRRIRGEPVVERWPVRYREELEPDHDFDLILLSVQHYRLAEAAEFLAPRIGTATVLVLSNLWVEPLDAIGDLPPDQVAWGFPQSGGAFGEDGTLHAALLPSITLGTLGAPLTARELTVRRLFREAGFRIMEQPDLRGWLWIHFATDAGLHAQGLRRGSLADLAGARRDLREALLTSRELLPLLEARGVDLRRHRGSALLLRAPSWLTAGVLAWLTTHVRTARLSLEAHCDPEAEEPRAVCRDALAEARRLGIATPRLEAAEPSFAHPATTASVAALPLVRPHPCSPPAEHLRRREQEPVAKGRLPSGAVVWALTRHADIRTVLTDARFSSDRARYDFPPLNPNEGAPALRTMITMDPPDHTHARRAVVGEFTVKRIAALRPRLQQIVDERIDAMLDGPRPVDLVQALSLPVPSLAICELLGVPYDDHEYFQDRSSTLISRETSPDDLQRAVGELAGYLAQLVAAKEKEPTDDLLSRQLAKQRKAGAVDHAALVGTAFLLLVAGHETTANMISLGTMTLLENPEYQEAIRQDPSRTPVMVEEMLRYFTIAELAATRIATEDVEIGGVLIRAGDGVVGLSNTGNRDPEVFENPDTFDIGRGSRNHLAFGHGSHQCMGQSLARLELQIVFDTLVRRVPDLRLAVPAADLPFKDDANIYGIHELPVTW